MFEKLVLLVVTFFTIATEMRLMIKEDLNNVVFK